MIVGWIMRLAPFGLAALLLQLVATQEGGLLKSLGHFIVVVTGTTLFHGLVVLPLILWLFTRMSPIHFFKGTALYEAAAALFVARLAGIELDIASQMIIFLVAMLGAIGAPGIPSVGMLSMVLVLESVGLPTEAIAILLPIDRILDTVRTAVNVEGDMVGSLIVHRLAAVPESIGRS